MKINIQKLDVAMARACMTGKELQKQAEISDVSLAKIRGGTQEPRPSTVGRIARALGVDVEAIVEEVS